MQRVVFLLKRCRKFKIVLQNQLPVKIFIARGVNCWLENGEEINQFSSNCLLSISLQAKLILDNLISKKDSKKLIQILDIAKL